MIKLGAQHFGTAAELRDHLGPDITPALLRDWRRRRLITSHRIGRSNVYPLDEVIEAEHTTRDRTKPRRQPCLT